MEAEQEQFLQQENKHLIQEQEVAQLFNRHYNEYGDIGIVASIMFLKKMFNDKLVESKKYHEAELEKIKVLAEELKFDLENKLT